METLKLTPWQGDPKHAKYIERTIRVAEANVREGGRPFATIIVKTETGEIVAEGGNQVKQTGDPTAHAEVVAIRKLSASIGENMSGYTFYILAHPCPMCLAAMYYTSPDEVIFLTTREEYAQHYIDPRKYIRFTEFYGEFGKHYSERRMPMTPQLSPDAVKVYKLWAELNKEEKESLFALGEEMKKKDEEEAKAKAAK
eukprot:TRINITY_DN8712_c0_g1_i1.p1 TRINITY_DN8712_c0_g1~~TRINITY_DN8712_c0_g1_i1.p1  ORF type:complete len:198 (-),score=66.51 TRINITY_DN8712_c0_g1_i1:204-797(-)